VTMCLVPIHGVRDALTHHEYTITTLGNGYLGSRIDEERSEMRYLV
jgi:trehalose/maltose hydrolase-like predicted phosphorylase